MYAISMTRRQEVAMRVVFKKIKSIHHNVRTLETIGECEALPEVGRGFVMSAESMEKPKDTHTRLIWTSTVQRIIEATERSMTFETENSTYCVEVLPN